MNDNSSSTSPVSAKGPSSVSVCLDVIRSSALFSGLSENICSRISFAATRRTLARRETLFMQGDEIRNFTLVESGAVKQTKIGRAGDEVVLRICCPGDIVSGDGYPATSRHNYSAWAVEESAILIWRNDHMRTYLKLYPQLAVNMTGILSARLNEIAVRFREVATEELTTRVALLLVRLCGQMGTKSKDGIKIDLTREEIAQMAGASMFTISRLLSRWSERGLVLAPRRSIIVCDVQRLICANGAENTGIWSR